MGRRLQLLLALAVVTTALGAVTASGASFVSDSTTTVQASTSGLGADTMVIAGGNGQTAVAGTAVATAPSVYVYDGSGNPVSGLTVTFSVWSGGGSVTGAAAVTGDDGIATVGSWTLGPVPGANALRATCAGVSGSPVTFTATGVVGSGHDHGPQRRRRPDRRGRRTVAVDPSVKVTDAGGNPVSGVAVTFAVASGGGSVTGADRDHQRGRASPPSAAGAWGRPPARTR